MVDESLLLLICVEDVLCKSLSLLENSLNLEISLTKSCTRFRYVAELNGLSQIFQNFLHSVVNFYSNAFFASYGSKTSSKVKDVWLRLQRDSFLSGSAKLPPKTVDVAEENLGEESQKHRSSLQKPLLLLYGAKGFMGNNIRRYFGSKFCIQASSQRPGQYCDSSLLEELMNFMPEYVVCALGRSHVGMINNADSLEGGPDKLVVNLRDNLFGPAFLAKSCFNSCIHFTYIGTACLYKYTDVCQFTDSFCEQDRPNNFGSSFILANIYTGRMISHYTSRALYARMRLGVSKDWSDRNVIVKLLSFKEILDIPNSYSILPTLLPLLARMVRSKANGIYNIANEGTLCHSEILRIWEKHLNRKLSWKILNRSSSLHAELLQKRSNCKLNLGKLSKVFPSVPNVADAVEQVIKEIVWEQKSKLQSHL